MNRLSLIALTVLFALAGCKKDDRILGTDVQPEGDALAGETRTMNVSAYSEKGDSIISFNSQFKFLGAYYEPVFGETKVGLYLNANTTLVDFTFPTTSTVIATDITLAVDVLNYYGDPGATLTYSVYAIDSSLNAKRNYYTSNNRYHASRRLIAVHTGSTEDTVQVIRIPLDKTYINNMILDAPNLKDNATFQKTYKGFYIEASRAGNDGVIRRVDLHSGRSGLFITYRTDTVSGNKSFLFTFSGTESAKYNTITYDPSAAASALKSQLSGDTTSASEIIYVKGFGNIHARIKIPDISSIADSFRVSVNRAELSLFIDESYAGNSRYRLPLNMALLPLDARGRDSIATDQLNAGDNSRYDGNYDEVQKRYVFNIARHVQAILNGKRSNYGFRLEVTDPQILFTPLRDTRMERVVLYGTGKSLKPKFTVNYVKLEKK
jgi:hypothetical protein